MSTSAEANSGSAPFAAHFDFVAEHGDAARERQSGFHRMLAEFHAHHIPKGSCVLEWGCGKGELLNALQPSRGLGIDFSERMIARARRDAAPGCEYRVGDVLHDHVDERFDHIVLSYLIGYLPDIQHAFEQLHASAHARTRLHLTSLNTLWSLPLSLASKVGLVMPQPPSNWLSRQDLLNLLELSGWEAISTSTEQLCPLRIPLLAPFFNRFLVRLPLFRHLGLTLAITARPKRAPVIESDISCSVIVPARNEAGNIRAALERIPTLNRRTEVIFVEGHSRDDTWAAIQRELAAYQGPHLVRAVQQPGKGKWDAVYTGFALARGDVLVIQDADLTAPPEDLPKFYEALASGRAEFVNGSRLVYPMEKQAMRFLNLLGNKFFALALSYVLGQPVKDSLCGTKMILRADYERLLRRIAPFGNFDPFGDFNLLFGSSLLDLRIRDLPVRYRDRTYGETNISRFRHGLMLLRMTWFGLRKLRWH